MQLTKQKTTARLGGLFYLYKHKSVYIFNTTYQNLDNRVFLCYISINKGIYIPANKK